MKNLIKTILLLSLIVTSCNKETYLAIKDVTVQEFKTVSTVNIQIDYGDYILDINEYGRIHNLVMNANREEYDYEDNSCITYYEFTGHLNELAEDYDYDGLYIFNGLLISCSEYLDVIYPLWDFNLSDVLDEVKQLVLGYNQDLYSMNVITLEERIFLDTLINEITSLSKLDKIDYEDKVEQWQLLNTDNHFKGLFSATLLSIANHSIINAMYHFDNDVEFAAPLVAIDVLGGYAGGMNYIIFGDGPNGNSRDFGKAIGSGALMGSTMGLSRFLRW